MTTRRQFIGTGVAAVGTVAGCAAQGPVVADRYTGPHEMPRNVTLLSMVNSDGTETLGVKTGSGIIDVRSAARGLGIVAPLTLDELLKEGNAAGLNKVIQARPATIDESKIRYGRLFRNPGKIVCVGLNYRRHAAEVGAQPPRVPPLFNKFNNALAPHNGIITLPPREIAYKFDYETELLIVMGKAARNVTESEALNYVAGYCTANDFSARDLQTELPFAQWMIGKTLDNFAPIGPYFVSADLVGDPNNLKIETRVNGAVRQSWNTNDFIFNTQKMIAYISKHWTLEPGDIIFTGTPHGVIAGYPPDKQVWLKAGDEIHSSIEKLGELKFRLG